jgi:hypothetical protein
MNGNLISRVTWLNNPFLFVKTSIVELTDQSSKLSFNLVFYTFSYHLNSITVLFRDSIQY